MRGPTEASIGTPLMSIMRGVVLDPAAQRLWVLDPAEEAFRPA